MRRALAIVVSLACLPAAAGAEAATPEETLVDRADRQVRQRYEECVYRTPSGRPRYVDGMPGADITGVLGAFRRAQAPAEANALEGLTRLPAALIHRDAIRVVQLGPVSVTLFTSRTFATGDVKPAADRRCRARKRRTLRGMLAGRSASLRRRALALQLERMGPPAGPPGPGLWLLERREGRAGYALTGGRFNRARFERGGFWMASGIDGESTQVTFVVPDGVATVNVQNPGSDVTEEVTDNVAGLIIPGSRPRGTVIWRAADGRELRRAPL